MLTDIFALRYSSVKIWDEFNELQRRLIVQSFRLLEENICPYYVNGKESERGKVFWTDIHSRLSMELGVKSLSPLAYSYQNMWQGKANTVTGFWPIITVCENWALASFDGSTSADRFIKERLSLVEIGFRKRDEEIAKINAELPNVIAAAKLRAQIGTSRTLRLPGDYTEGLKAANQTLNANFKTVVQELNTRFRQADCDLNYHNGFIQLSSDLIIKNEIETPFWGLVAMPLWKNVDTDMKEAVDRRDTGGRDPVFYAARALESTIKIISDEKGWSHGKEKGAHNYIDNLASKNAAFLSSWEGDDLKVFFTKVRNPFGHGPGKHEMPSLTKEQMDWAIETCMAWIKSLIKRS